LLCPKIGLDKGGIVVEAFMKGSQAWYLNLYDAVLCMENVGARPNIEANCS
jgi:hypothetical protein